jgi:hypothetical protein
MATRRVSFYQLAVLADGAVTYSDDVDWPACLKEFFVLPSLEGRRFEGPSGDDLVAWGTGLPCQAVLGRVLDGSPGLSEGNWHDDAAQPIVPASDDQFFSRTTYLQFLPRSNVVALVSGAGVKPNKGHVEAFADKIAPLGGGRFWRMEPITEASQIPRFKRMKGATKAVIKTSVQPTTLPLDPDDGSQQPLDQMLGTIAHNLGAGLDISLKISIKKPTDNRGAGSALQDVILRSRHLLDDAKQVTVTAYDGITDEIVELIEHRMTTSIELPDDSADGTVTETLVLAGLADACERLEAAVCNAARLGH